MNILELRELLAKTYQTFNIRSADAIIDCGSALVLHDVVPNTYDIDVDLPEVVFKGLAEKHPTHEALLGPAIQLVPGVNAHIRLEAKNYKSTMLNGFHVQRLPYVKQTYQKIIRIPHLSQADKVRYERRIRLIDHAISCPMRRSWYIK